MTSLLHSNKGPLSDIRVLELAGKGPAPYACMILADLGADVIRVDRPEDRPSAGPTDLHNRGKRSVVLDLKRPEAVAAVLDLARGVDIFIEGFRPGVVERLGLGPDEVWQRNPQVVYGRMTGWGQDGPWAQRAGHDIDYVAVTGALHAIGDADGPPQIPLNLLGDYGGGSTFLVIGVLAAVLEARRNGRGQVVDAAILDGVSHLLAQTRGMHAGKRWTDRRGVNMFDGGTPFYALYETADGGYMAVGALEPQFFSLLLSGLAIGSDLISLKDQWNQDGWSNMRSLFAARFRSKTREEWCRLFADSDACVAPVLSLSEASTHPQLAARGSLLTVDGVVQPRPAPRFSRHAAPAVGTPARPGADTTHVLTAAGLDAVALIEAGAAHQADAPTAD